MAPWEGPMDETSSSATISTKLQRIAKLAKEAPQMAFTTLAHHVDLVSVSFHEPLAHPAA